MDVLSLALYFAELGLVGLVLYFVIGALAMPDWARTVAQVLLILIFVVAAIGAVVGPSKRVPLMAPYPPGPASIVR